LAAGHAGPGPPRSLRRAALPLRHPAAVVPEEPGAARGGALAGRAAERPCRVHGGRRAGPGFDALRTRPADPGSVADDPQTARAATAAPLALADRFQQGLAAPICLTWELTYACNLSCVHCLSSSGRRDPRELTTAECQAVIDELQRMQVFYVNIGGGEP